MDGLTLFITIIVMLIITFIGMIRAETLLGMFMCFILLTFIAYITIYLFNA
jgi:hypothetical protein